MIKKQGLLPEAIRITGARQNNLKNLDLNIPFNQITVVTGVSGSGKSSLAFDTLYAEGQRRYIETFSPYARQFMDRMDRPRVDSIENIPPAIAIDRKDPVRTSRSTVGTMTELTDHVKLLYARLGHLHCKRCGNPVLPETPAHVWQTIQGLSDGSKMIITFPVAATDTSPKQLRKQLGGIGFTRLYSGGEIRSLDRWQPREVEEEVQVVADRILSRSTDRKRIMDSLEQAFHFGDGRLDLWVEPDQHFAFSNRLVCAGCNIPYHAPIPNLFSFNSPVGACETCRGFGRTIDIDLDLIIPNSDFSLEAGAIKPFGGVEQNRMEFKDLMDFCRKKKIPTDLSFRHLKKAQKEAIIKGTTDYYGIRGFFQWLETKTYKMHVRVYLSRYRSYLICPDCRGTRFKNETLLYQLGGLNIGQVYALSIDRADDFFNSLPLSSGDAAGRLILSEVRNRLGYLRDVGLGYLTLDRQSRTLSGGEVQRVALISALGSSLVNSLYILDEPSIGLHPRDNHRLIKIIKGLRDLGNTIVVVEHDPEIISQSDFMLDMGPKAGEQGGQVIYFGPTSGVQNSLTGQYLRGKKVIPMPVKRRQPKKGISLIVKGAAAHNLKQIDVEIPLGLLVCLTGVSGSGKSSLAEEIIYKGLKRAKGDSKGSPGAYKTIKGIQRIDEVVLVDQRPIGRTPRANPLTYTKALDPVRRLFAATASARSKGFDPGYFSFNVAKGRCNTCKGEGFEKVEMQFLSDVYLTCPSCNGKRFKKNVLEITYRGKNISDIFSMTVDQAIYFFQDHPQIIDVLKPLLDVGLSYMRLGQPINTLSGGEAQRLKLSRYLKEGNGGPQLFIFDEPTTGLHFEDINILLTALQRVVDQGNSVLIIEHNMDVVKAADWVIDLGPEGGDAGGEVVVSGPPEKMAGHIGSHTGKFLKKYLSSEGRLQPQKRRSKPVPKSGSDLSSIISIKGAKENNLKDLSLSIPRQKLVVITGVSGSGKSTLAYDILFAEGQRRYLETLAPYVRQYVKIQERPDVDAVLGLPATVAIQQRISHRSRRSTAATLTEIYHFLRLLYSKLGRQHCPGCNRRLTTQTIDEIVKQIQKRYRGKHPRVLAAKVSGRKGFHKEILAKALLKGFSEARIDGEITALQEGMSLSRFHEHTIEVVVGRFIGKRSRDLLSRTLEEGGGSLIVLDDKGHEEIFSLKKVCPACGIGLPDPDPRLFSFNSRHGACTLCDGLGQLGDSETDRSKTCPVCGGSRLKPEALSVKINGLSIYDVVQQSADRVFEIFKGISFAKHELPVAKPIMAEIMTRLSFLHRLGLSYLSLSRSGNTLSGGEAHRIRLAAQLGSNLTGVCYILDEPTIGLHARDNRMLLDALKELRKQGNSLVVVEHDEETIREADHIIDLGPGAGQNGGRLVASGTLAGLKKIPASVTGASFNGNPHKIYSPLRPYRKRARLKVIGAVENNLKGIDVEFPLRTFICITGVSGSGKSTLLKETVYKTLHNRLNKQKSRVKNCKGIKGWQSLDRVLEVDHSPIGRTPRSVPASYVGFLGDIRKLFAMTPSARARGYRPGRFSFNTSGGRCESCKGHGAFKVAMSFLPDVYVRCETCSEMRFNQETLNITYKGKNISEILNFTFDEAAAFFSAVPSIQRAVRLVCDIGLGYLCLGQASPTLSGGEAQRIKLAAELSRSGRGHTFYILDEPTTGLHLADVENLLNVLQALVDQGNTIAVIEHNMEIIKEADYVIDLGPEGGSRGGEVVATGSPLELIASSNGSHTAKYLKKYLNA